MSARAASPPARLHATLRGAILDVDAGWAALTARTHAALTVATVWDLVDEADHDRLREAFDQLATTTRPQSLSAVVRDATGAGVSVELELTSAVGGEVELRAWALDVVGEQEVSEAWDTGALVLYVQPIRDAATLATVRHEVLVRMLRSGGRTAPASAFLGAIERLGLATRLDAWVARESVTMLAAIHDEAALEMNVCPASVGHAEPLLRALSEQLAQTPIDASRLTVALPSAAVVRQPEAARTCLLGLRAMGLSTALDHVAGSSAELAILEDLQFDIVKITAAVAEAAVSTAGAQQLGRVIDAAHRHAARTVATSLEDQSALPAVCREGVEELQGYRLGAPRTAEEWLRRH